MATIIFSIPFIILLSITTKSLRKKGFNLKKSISIFLISSIPTFSLLGLLHSIYTQGGEGALGLIWAALTIFYTLGWIICLEIFRYERISAKHVFASIFSAMATMAAVILFTSEFYNAAHSIFDPLVLRHEKEVLLNYGLYFWVLLTAIPLYRLGLIIGDALFE